VPPSRRPLPAPREKMRRGFSNQASALIASCIVCGIYDSSGARKAARVADGLARNLGARPVLVHGDPVAPSVMYGVPFDSETFHREPMEDARRLLDDAGRACTCETVSKPAELGSPIEVLVRALEAERARSSCRWNTRPRRDALGAARQRRPRDARGLPMPRRRRPASHRELTAATTPSRGRPPSPVRTPPAPKRATAASSDAQTTTAQKQSSSFTHQPPATESDPGGR
jgi:hypothetical protein